MVLVTYTATPLDISALLANPKIGAILHVGQPSTTVLGVGELLFGKKSPAGRTVQTIYPAAYAAEVSIFDFNMRPGPSSCLTDFLAYFLTYLLTYLLTSLNGPTNFLSAGPSLFPRPDCAGGCGSSMGTNPGRTHRFYTGKAVVPFGFGLSYTTWKYEPQGSVDRVDLTEVRALLMATKEAGRTFPSSHLVAAAEPLVSYYIKVTNTGKVDSDDVVLGFLVPPNAGKDGMPLQTLYAFERVHVKAGASVMVNMCVDYASLSEAAARADLSLLPPFLTPLRFLARSLTLDTHTHAPPRPTPSRPSSSGTPRSQTLRTHCSTAPRPRRWASGL